MMWNDMLYGNYRNLKFTDVWGSADAFIMDYSGIGIPETIESSKVNTLYYLLYARYGNSTIASSDINQFKYKVFSAIYMYGPAWSKRLDLQLEAAALNIEDVMNDGGSAIYNHAYNPSQAPSTDTINELPYINDQNTTKYKKSRVDAIATILSLLETDVTEEFISKFKKLFLTIVEPELPLWYITETAEEDF